MKWKLNYFVFYRLGSDIRKWWIPCWQPSWSGGHSFTFSNPKIFDKLQNHTHCQDHNLQVPSSWGSDCFRRSLRLSNELCHHHHHHHHHHQTYCHIIIQRFQLFPTMFATQHWALTATASPPTCFAQVFWSPSPSSSSSSSSIQLKTSIISTISSMYINIITCPAQEGRRARTLVGWAALASSSSSA